MPDRPIPPTPPGSTPCRVLLRAVHGALRLPLPADEPDEHPYLLVRSKRASLAEVTIDMILRDPEASDRDFLVAADALSRQLLDYPPDGYEHSGLSS
jgi:hypothetical protein